MTAVLRTLAVLVAVAAAVDPAISASRSRPVSVEFRVGPGEHAAQVRARLLEELGDRITVAHKGQGDAVVVIDERVDTGSIRDDVAVSAVVGRSGGPNVRLLAARVPSRFLTGQEAAVGVDAEVQGMAGRTSILTVSQNGVEIGRTEHTWSGAGHERLSVPFVTMAAGTHAVRVTAAPFEDEIRRDDNTADARLVTVDGPLRIAFVEPRPSWSAGFLRRALESDPSFDVASVVRPSRGIDVRTANAPATLGALSAIPPRALDRFDVVLAGAPEELRTTDLEALRSFMTERGGTVVFLPDRRPTGPYAAFVTASGFDEVLLENPVVLESNGVRRAPRASEFAIPRRPSPAMRALASLPDHRPAIASWPVGEGALIFSGALDAWRFRAHDDDRFASFWRSSIAAAALAAPPAVQVELQPAVVHPGGETRVIARIRRTEFDRSPDGTIRLPRVGAVATSTLGGRTTTEAVRLWPTSAPGVFEGRFTPTGAGLSEVQVTAGQARGSALVVHSDSPRVEDDPEEARLVASATGGAVGLPDNLAPIVNHLRSRSRAVSQEAVHPMRSGWWTAPFALALSAEWALRRRRGER